MPWTDWINGAFEIVAGAFFYLSVRKIKADREVRGVHWVQLLFSSAWGLWNLPFYAALGQWLSFAGAVGLAVINCWYLWLVLVWSDKEDLPAFMRNRFGRRNNASL